MEVWSDAGDDIVLPNLHQKRTTANRTLIQKNRNHFGVI